jgi:hypothetical protein
MEFLYGLAGSLVAIGLLGAGFFMGWKAHGYIGKASAPVAEKPTITAKERKQLEEQQAAFHQLLNYNADLAYQAEPEKDESEEGHK